MNTAAIEHLPRVAAGLRYLEPPVEKPRTLEFDPPPGVPKTTAVYREHTVEIRDVRPVASTLSLEHEGFQLLTAPTSVENFDDDAVIRTRYYAETISLLEELTGASRVVVFDHTIRRRVPARRIVQPATRGSQCRVCITTTRRGRGHNGCGICSATRLMSCCRSASRSSMCGGRFAGPSRIHRLLLVTPAVLPRVTWWQRISSILIAPVRSTT